MSWKDNIYKNRVSLDKYLKSGFIWNIFCRYWFLKFVNLGWKHSIKQWYSFPILWLQSSHNLFSWLILLYLPVSIGSLWELILILVTLLRNAGSSRFKYFSLLTIFFTCEYSFNLLESAILFKYKSCTVFLSFVITIAPLPFILLFDRLFNCNPKYSTTYLINVNHEFLLFSCNFRAICTTDSFYVLLPWYNILTLYI